MKDALMHLAPRAAVVSALLAAWIGVAPRELARAESPVIHTFERRQLSDVYYSEGVGVGDLNRDGHPDVVYGPYWFAGPEFQKKHEIYPPRAQNRERYADHFFAWVYDLNGDGWNDIVTAGFPGTPAYVYENPRTEGHTRHWPRHAVFPQVGNESPHFTNLVGDDRPELVCTKDGYYGYATFDPAKPFEAWTFHPISDKVAPIPFGHGLGVGDVNNDGRLDLLMKDGWYEQPAAADQATRWAFHPARFAPIGGAEIYAYDVDGDGDNDVITSLAAHDFGLAWHEQVDDGGKPGFREHLIMGDQPWQNRYGLVFSEPHSVCLADIDGDGLKDIVTGKTYYSHHKQSPMWDAGAVVYWFRLVRGNEGVDWVPYKADGEAGIGRQLVVADVNGDGLPDIASGGMKGAHVLSQRRQRVDEAAWKAHQPQPYTGARRSAPHGPQGAIDAKTGHVAEAIEAETLHVLGSTSGKAGRQDMARFRSGHWSGGAQLVWSGAKPGDRLDLELNVPSEGRYDILAALTLARDYGVVRFAIDGEPLGEPLDLYSYPQVLASGELVLGSRTLSAGKHTLAITIDGANPAALRAYMVGVDYLRLSAR